jgi:hypothetical protein
MSNTEQTETQATRPLDFYDVASKITEEASSVTQPYKLLKAWTERYPEYAADLTSLAYARAAEPASDNAVVLDIDEAAVISSARVVLERLNGAPAPLNTLSGPAKAIGISTKALAELLRLDLPMFAKLEQRLFELNSIPAALIENVAAAINRSTADVIAYLASPPKLAAGASYKSQQAPSVMGAAQQDFAEALKSSKSISEDNREYWSKEIEADKLS